MRLQASLIALATIFGALVLEPAGRLDQPSSSAATTTTDAFERPQLAWFDEIRSARVLLGNPEHPSAMSRNPRAGATKRVSAREDPVEEGSIESFPASDSPAY